MTDPETQRRKDAVSKAKIARKLWSDYLTGTRGAWEVLWVSGNIQGRRESRRIAQLVPLYFFLSVLLPLLHGATKGEKRWTIEIG